MIFRFMLVAAASPFVAMWLAVRYPKHEGETRADEIGGRFKAWVTGQEFGAQGRAE